MHGRTLIGASLAVWALALAHPGAARGSECKDKACSSGDSLPSCERGVLPSFVLQSVLSPNSGSDAYVPSSSDALESIEASILAFLNGEEQRAWDEAFVAGYFLCRGSLDEAGLALWRPTLGGTGRAIFAVRAGAARPLIVEAPHPVYDRGTAEQALRIFDALEARALVVSGTHRCANKTSSACAGGTSVCGYGFEPYRESDMAHSVNSVFHAAHRTLAERFSSDLVLSLHGMNQDGIHVSDGTTVATSTATPVAQLARILGEVFPDEKVVSCNAWAPGSSTDEHLCGTTNVQGHHVNGLVGEAICTGTATRSTGRFLHLEQSQFVRDHPDWVVEAMEKLVPEIQEP